jgi:hypothetical protein
MLPPEYGHVVDAAVARLRNSEFWISQRRRVSAPAIAAPSATSSPASATARNWVCGGDGTGGNTGSGTTPLLGGVRRLSLAAGGSGAPTTPGPVEPPPPLAPLPAPVDQETRPLLEQLITLENNTASLQQQVEAATTALARHEAEIAVVKQRLEEAEAAQAGEEALRQSDDNFRKLMGVTGPIGAALEEGYEPINAFAYIKAYVATVMGGGDGAAAGAGDAEAGQSAGAGDGDGVGDGAGDGAGAGAGDAGPGQGADAEDEGDREEEDQEEEGDEDEEEIQNEVLEMVEDED